MNMKNEMPPKQGFNDLSPKQKENFENLLSTMVLTESNKEDPEKSALNIKKEFLKILPEFIEINNLEELEKISDKKELLKQYTEQISNTKVGWGFTPKLALEKDEGVYGLDCTGAAIALGAICEKHQIPIEIGREINHAVIIAYIEGEKYYADPRNNNFFKIETVPQKFENYNLYKLSDKEQEKTTLHYSLLATSTLDEFIGNAILGNIEELRKLSMGNESAISQKDQGAKVIAQKYKNDLTKDDWGTIHDKLYPNVENYLKENKQLWEDEETRIKNLIEEKHLKEVLDNVILETEKSLGYSKEELEKIYRQIILELKEKYLEVINFLKTDDISNSFTGISGNYINELKKYILPLNNKEKTYIIKSIENRLTK